MAGAAGAAIWDWEMSQSGWRVPEATRRAYADIDEGDGRELAHRAVDLLEATSKGHPSSDALRESATMVLVRLACFLPGVLHGLHVRLIEQGVPEDLGSPAGLDPHVVYHGADAVARDRLLSLLGSNPPRAYRSLVWLLLSLAWVSDERVLEAFEMWTGSPPAWVPESFSQQAAAWLSGISAFAGWTIGQTGERRVLYRSGGARLVEGGDTNVASVGGTDEEHCGWCGGPLTVLLDLVPNERLGILGLPPGRLRIPTCEFCVCYGTVLVEVDLAGGALV